MKTKERICVTALQLFNREGVKEVTLRKIAKEMGISQGNLNYHFRTKGEIVSTLYFELVDKMNAVTDKMTNQNSVFSHLFESSFEMMNIFFEYRFLMKDFYSVLHSHPDLKSHYKELQFIRKQQYLQLFHQLVNQNLIRHEEFEDEYSRLYERMTILGDNWINTAILFSEENQKMVEYYHKLLFEVLYPYLTNFGKVEFKTLIESKIK